MVSEDYRKPDEVFPCVRPLLARRENAGQLDALFAERRAKGLEAYGHPLSTWNGRDALKDAFEELADAVLYFEQARLEALDRRCYGDDEGEARNVRTLAMLRDETLGVLSDAMRFFRPEGGVK